MIITMKKHTNSLQAEHVVELCKKSGHLVFVKKDNKTKPLGV